MNKHCNFKNIEKIIKLFAIAGLILILPACDKTKSSSIKSTAKNKVAQTSKAKELKRGLMQADAGEATFDEMVAQIEFDVQKGHYLSAAQWLDKIIRRYPENPQIVEFKYKRAECCFLGKKYMLASEAYDNFAKLYPNDPREKEAKFLALSSLYNHTKNFSVDCDSSMTKEVINACNKMLQEESMTEKHKQVASIMKHCQDRLLNKEVAVFDSFIRRKNFDSASRRLEKIKAEHLAGNQQLEPRLVYLECKLAAATKNEDKAKNCLDILEEQFSDSKYAKMASSYINSGSLASVIYG